MEYFIILVIILVEIVIVVCCWFMLMLLNIILCVNKLVNIDIWEVEIDEINVFYFKYVNINNLLII